MSSADVNAPYDKGNTNHQLRPLDPPRRKIVFSLTPNSFIIHTFKDYANENERRSGL